MTRRSYAQYCGLAHALDVLGERWSLLVVRELLIGPKRFSDLQDGLVGIGANALSARLKSLEADGLVTKRHLPPPAASTVYELTDRGRALDPVVTELIRWGLPLLADASGEDSFRPGWLVTSLRATFDPEAAAGVRRTYVLKVDGEAFRVRIDDGSIEVEQGEDPAADVVVTMDSQTLLAIGTGALSAEQAMESGGVVVEKGDPADAVALGGMQRLSAAAGAQV